jgi:acyl-CoA dehydrogenase
MDFGLTQEQEMIVETTRSFVENELYRHEAEVERTGHLDMDLVREIQAEGDRTRVFTLPISPKNSAAPASIRRHGSLYEKELGRANYALHWTCVARPSNILCAGTPEQRAKLSRAVRGRREMGLSGHDRTRRGLGSARNEGECEAGRHGLGSERHQTFHLPRRHRRFHDLPSWRPARRTRRVESKKLITAFFVDKGTPGYAVRDGYRNVSHRGYTNAVLEFDNCRIPAENVLGEVHKGFEVANTWLGATRLQVGATCLGRADRAFRHSVEWAATREQFGQPIGKFQGVSFKLADMAMEMKAAELMILEAGWKFDRGEASDSDMAMAKLKATEMLAMVADEAIQIHGGMGLMDELPLERIWRDARIERIWEGTSEIQRHIISRALLRPFGA